MKRSSASGKWLNCHCAIQRSSKDWALNHQKAYYSTDPRAAARRVSELDVKPTVPAEALIVSMGTISATVQRAVDAATAGDEIRVAAGTYTGVQARAGITPQTPRLARGAGNHRQRLEGRP
mgnify:CR=1 FL=1